MHSAHALWYVPVRTETDANRVRGRADGVVAGAKRRMLMKDVVVHGAALHCTTVQRAPLKIGKDKIRQ